MTERNLSTWSFKHFQIFRTEGMLPTPNSSSGRHCSSGTEAGLGQGGDNCPAIRLVQDAYSKRVILLDSTWISQEGWPGDGGRKAWLAVLGRKGENREHPRPNNPKGKPRTLVVL